ncbi:MAG: phosphorylase [Bacteroidetes bacterium]|jgi:uridine phosphorylase|nr:phosphorylase [Bacteroidota bacterium]
MKIPASELPKQSSGAIYHLNLFPEDIADNIILVGDPGRVSMISQHFDTIDIKKSNRELYTHTGTKNGKRISAISTGMGPDNVEIVMNELDALVNIDLEKMEVKPEHHSLNLVRVGTSGSLDGRYAPGTIVASEYGFGLDGLLQFYDHEGVDEEDVVNAFIEHTGWGEKLPYPYCVKCSDDLMQRIAVDMVKGMTLTAPGFFAPQGRAVRGPLKFPDMNKKIESFEYKGLRCTNMEMECASLYGLSRVLGHNALTCCVLIANRVTGEFLDDYHDLMNQLVAKVVDRF